MIQHNLKTIQFNPNQNLNEVPLLFLLLLVRLVSYPKNHCQDQCQGAFPYVFFQEFWGFRPQTFTLF